MLPVIFSVVPAVGWIERAPARIVGTEMPCEPPLTWITAALLLVLLITSEPPLTPGSSV